MAAVVRNHIANYHIDLAINGMFELAYKTEIVFIDNSIFNELTLHKSKYNKLRTEKRLGVKSYSELTTEESKLIYDLLELLDKIVNYIRGTELPCQKTTAQLILEGNIEQFDNQREKLKKIIAAILDIDESEVVIKRVIPGSIKVYLDLPEGKAEELKKIFDNGKNEKLKKLEQNFNLKSFDTGAILLESINRLEKVIASSLRYAKLKF